MPDSQTGPMLEVGTQAPDFDLRSQHGEQIALSAFAGVSNVLLIFYPFAWSGVCMGELADLRDNADMFASYETEILAVSCDPVYTLRMYAETERLYFSLLSDYWPHGATTTAYGLFNQTHGCPERGSYLIDREGTIRWTVRSGLFEPRDIQAYADAVAALEG